MSYFYIEDDNQGIIKKTYEARKQTRHLLFIKFR